MDVDRSVDAFAFPTKFVRYFVLTLFIFRQELCVGPDPYPGGFVLAD